MPTRYTVDITLEKVSSKELKDPVKRKKARFQIRVKFEERLVRLMCVVPVVLFRFLFQVQGWEESLVLPEAQVLS